MEGASDPPKLVSQFLLRKTVVQVRRRILQCCRPGTPDNIVKVCKSNALPVDWQLSELRVFDSGTSAGLQVSAGGLVDAGGLSSCGSSGETTTCGERTACPASVARGET